MSVQELLDFGMVANPNDPIFPYSKDLTEKENDDDSDEKIELAVYLGRNQYDFVLSIPDSLIFLAVENVQDLQTVERLILGYELKY